MSGATVNHFSEGKGHRVEIQSQKRYCCWSLFCAFVLFCPHALLRDLILRMNYAIFKSYKYMYKIF